jgi:hypothetical protein
MKLSVLSKFAKSRTAAGLKTFSFIEKQPSIELDNLNPASTSHPIPPHPTFFEETDRVLLVSDFLMTKESEQDSNLRWLSDLYASALKNGVGTPVSLASKYYNNLWAFDRVRFFELSGLICNLLDTHFDFDPSQMSQESIEYLRSFLPKSTLVVGYELSINTRAVLDILGVRYIDIWLGPIRFLEDLTFALYSNDYSINLALDSQTISDSYIKAQAAVLKVQSYRGFSKRKSFISKGSALFAGQMLVDKALLKNGRMLNVLDFKKEFEAITKKYSTVYYARHPFLKGGDEDIMAFIKSFRNVQVSSETGYMVISDDNLEAVYGITSSLISEAKYFVSESVYLSKPMFEIAEDAERKYRLVMQQPLFPEFWGCLLSRCDCKISRLEIGKDKMRDALSFYWSYRQIDKLEHVRAIYGRKG